MVHNWVRVGRCEALPVGAAVRVEIDDDDAIAVFNVEGRLFAVDDLCPHMSGHLSQGAVADGEVTCPLHAWRYRLADGRRMDRRGSPVRSHPVEVADGWITIGVGAPDRG